jgi:hypothetical protein
MILACASSSLVRLPAAPVVAILCKAITISSCFIVAKLGIKNGWPVFYFTSTNLKSSKVTSKCCLPGAAATIPIIAFTLGGK